MNPEGILGSRYRNGLLSRSYVLIGLHAGKLDVAQGFCFSSQSVKTLHIYRAPNVTLEAALR